MRLATEYDNDQHTVNCGVAKSDVVDPSNMFNPEVVFMKSYCY